MTPFRAPQIRHVLEAVIRAASPHMAGESLRRAVVELGADSALWSELELQRNPLPEPTQRATMLTSPLMGAP